MLFERRPPSSKGSSVIQTTVERTLRVTVVTTAGDVDFCKRLVTGNNAYQFPSRMESKRCGLQIVDHRLVASPSIGCFFRDNLVALHFKYDQARRRFVKWPQNEIAVVPDFHKRILFSDEAHFWLNGYVNKQNYRIWSEANPKVYVETPLHPEKMTVWCAL
ncbi:hypothetical protein TNCV_3656791 [Trichonephila clavipes]|nr:hypothetical protein TNCV_3656791 [Trichonephila clavipes]